MDQECQVTFVFSTPENLASQADGLGENQNTDWQELARRASQETDPEKLIGLVRRLNSALQETTGNAKP